MKCTKVCEHEAITVQNNLASINAKKCVGCGKCAAGCPVGCIEMRGQTAAVD
jgi:electron transport complex protein RnfB